MVLSKSLTVGNNVNKVIEQLKTINPFQMEKLISTHTDLAEYGFENLLILDTKNNVLFNYSDEKKNYFYLPKDLSFLNDYIFLTNPTIFDYKIEDKNFCLVFLPIIERNGNHKLNSVYFFNYNRPRSEVMRMAYLTSILLSMVYLGLLFSLHIFHSKVTDSINIINQSIESQVYNRENQTKLQFKYIRPFQVLERKIAFIIANLKNSQEKFFELSEKFNLLVENSNDGIIIEELDGRISFCNSRLISLLGYESESDIVGRRFTDFITGTESLERYANETALREEVKSSAYKLNFSKMDGTKLSCLISGNAIYDRNGKLAGSYGAITDITEIESKEKEKQSVQQTLNEYLNLTEEVFILIKNKTIINTNNSFPNVFNLTKNEVINVDYTTALKNFKEFITHLDLLLNQVKKTAKMEYFEPQLNLWFLLSLTHIDSDLFTVTIQDITDLRKDEEFHKYIFEYSSSFTVITTQEKKLVFVSKSFSGITGYDSIWLSYNFNNIFTAQNQQTISLLTMSNKELTFTTLVAHIPEKDYIIHYCSLS